MSPNPSFLWLAGISPARKSAGGGFTFDIQRDLSLFLSERVQIHDLIGFRRFFGVILKVGNFGVGRVVTV